MQIHNENSLTPEQEVCMRETTKYLDRVRDLTKTRSDYALAKLLGVTEQAVNNYTKGRSVLDNWTALRIAELLRIPLEEVIAAAELDREKNEKKRDAWKRRLKNLGSAAGLACCASGGLHPTTGEPTSSAGSMLTSGSGITLLANLEDEPMRRSTNYTQWPACFSLRQILRALREAARSLRSRPATRHQLASFLKTANA